MDQHPRQSRILPAMAIIKQKKPVKMQKSSNKKRKTTSAKEVHDPTSSFGFYPDVSYIKVQSPDVTYEDVPDETYYTEDVEEIEAESVPEDVPEPSSPPQPENFEFFRHGPNGEEANHDAYLAAGYSWVPLHHPTRANFRKFVKSGGKSGELKADRMAGMKKLWPNWKEEVEKYRQKTWSRSRSQSPVVD